MEPTTSNPLFPKLAGDVIIYLINRQFVLVVRIGSFTPLEVK